MARRGLKIGLVAFAGTLLVGAGLYVALFPKLATWVVRTRVLPKVARRLDRTVDVRQVTVDRGHVILEGVTLRGPGDAAGAPLAEIAKITIDFDPWPALVGDVRLGAVVIESPRATLVRHADGTDNWRDLVHAAEPGGDGGAGKPGRMPARIVVHKGALAYHDAHFGLELAVAGVEAEARPHGHAHLELTDLDASHPLGPRVQVASALVDVDLDDIRRSLAVRLAGGSASLWPKMTLTGIQGTLGVAEEPGRTKLDLEGGYGGVQGTLWRAGGWLDLVQQEGEIHLVADRFTLDKIEKVLTDTPIVDPAKTALGASLDLKLHDGQLNFDGGLRISGLTLDHPWLADAPLANLALEGTVRGSYVQKARQLTLDRLTVAMSGVTVELDGAAALPGGEDSPGVVRAAPRLRAHLVVPAVPCQTVLAAIPAPVVPRLAGFRLKGEFTTDVGVDIDWANLDALDLHGSVGIFGCKAVKVPDDFQPARLNDEFDHVVEVEDKKFEVFVVGATSPDFVPLAEVSPYLTNSLISTEDYNFMHHRGFIPREFRTALISNLKQGYFKYGASSITMQLVKNLFLHHQKTLARKLQELFLTWYVETVLTKERLLELYVNIIEFGPGIYGIGPAARHYFGKAAKDLNPVESAFFSSILPNPRMRYMQYCKGELSKNGDAHVQRILKLQHERKFLTDEEYELALQTPLVFDRTEALPEEECRTMVLRMIKNTKPTQPKKRGG